MKQYDDGEDVRLPTIPLGARIVHHTGRQQPYSLWMLGADSYKPGAHDQYVYGFFETLVDALMRVEQEVRRTDGN